MGKNKVQLSRQSDAVRSSFSFLPATGVMMRKLLEALPVISLDQAEDRLLQPLSEDQLQQLTAGWEVGAGVCHCASI